MEENSNKTPDPPGPEKKVQISFISEGGNPVPDPSDDEADLFVPPEVTDLNAVVDEYEFIRTIGQGGMGAVYEARQKSINRPVAIKVLQRIEDDEDLRFAERFEREVHVMAQLSHAHIVTVYSSGQTTDGQLFFVMEYVKGSDLQRIMQLEGLDTTRIFRWIEQICDALFYAHSMGVIHRDIKPGNILISEKGDVKIVDFGLAKLTGGGITDENTRLTMTNLAMGSPDYVAPEVLENGSTVDHRVDIYAIGVMLYEMLTGKIPRGAFKPPSSLVKGLHKGFDEVVLKAMDPDQELRYSDVGALSTSLMEIRDEPVVAEFASPQPSIETVAGSAALHKMTVTPATSAKKSATSAKKSATSAKKLARNTTSRRPHTEKKMAVKKSNTLVLAAWVSALVVTAGFLVFVAIRKSRYEAPIVVAPGGSKAISIEALAAARDEKHRKAALWILSKKGSVQILVSGQPARIVTAEAQLPKGGYTIVAFGLSNQSIISDELVVFEEVDTLSSVAFVQVDVNDTGLAHLSQSLRLTSINLKETLVTGSGFANFESPLFISVISAIDSPFSDIGMKELVRSFRLNGVDLAGTKITDVGLALLVNNATIVRLDISRTAVTSAGLDQLRGLTSINTLLVQDCPKISKASLQAFLKAHPGCTIVPPLEGDPASP